MPSDEKAFRDAIAACDKVLNGLPTRIVVAIAEQLLCDSLRQIDASKRAEVLRITFEVLCKRLTPHAMPSSPDSANK